MRVTSSKNVSRSFGNTLAVCFNRKQRIASIRHLVYKRPDFKSPPNTTTIKRDRHEQLNADAKSVFIDTYVPRANHHNQSI